MMSRSIALIATAMVCWAMAVAAQEPVAAPESKPVPTADAFCFRARPCSDCRAFLLTNSGAYLRIGAGPGVSVPRATVDWGAMVNLSAKHAVGASWFVTYDHEGTVFSTGPQLRWRRWYGSSRSLDVAVGTGIAGHAVRPGSLLGEVKYNPLHWLGVAARPELVRFDDYNCIAAGCSRPVSRTQARMYMGAELGGLPGLGLGVAGGLFLGVVILAFVTGNNN